MMRSHRYTKYREADRQGHTEAVSFSAMLAQHSFPRRACPRKQWSGMGTEACGVPSFGDSRASSHVAILHQVWHLLQGAAHSNPFWKLPSYHVDTCLDPHLHGDESVVSSASAWKAGISMFSSLLLVVLLFCFAITPAWGAFVTGKSMPPGDWNELRDGEFNIYYEGPDQKYAELLAGWYSEQLADFAAKLGVRTPRNVRVFIAPNEARFRYLTRGLPEWTGGAVYPRERVVVLLSPDAKYGINQFKAVALHEGVHLLTELDGNSHLPKWMAEGLAVYMSGETIFRRPSKLARAVVFDKTLTLEQIEGVLLLGPEDARLAYLESVSFVEYLVNEYGWPAIAQLVKGFRSGKDAETLFHEVTGRDYFTVEAAWHAKLRSKYKWWGIAYWIDFDSLLWIGAALLVAVTGIVTIVRRRMYYRSDPRSPDEWTVYDYSGDSTGDDPWTYTVDDEDDDDRY